MVPLNNTAWSSVVSELQNFSQKKFSVSKSFAKQSKL